MIMSNLPSWKGASEVYSKAYLVLGNMARSERGHAKSASGYWRGKKWIQTDAGYVSDEMKALIDALNDGDEEKIKGLLLCTHVYY
jgi:hypothetical protein